MLVGHLWYRDKGHQWQIKLLLYRTFGKAFFSIFDFYSCLILQHYFRGKRSSDSNLMHRITSGKLFSWKLDFYWLLAPPPRVSEQTDLKFEVLEPDYLDRDFREGKHSSLHFWEIAAFWLVGQSDRLKNILRLENPFFQKREHLSERPS